MIDAGDVGHHYALLSPWSLGTGTEAWITHQITPRRTLKGITFRKGWGTKRGIRFPPAKNSGPSRPIPSLYVRPIYLRARSHSLSRPLSVSLSLARSVGPLSLHTRASRVVGRGVSVKRGRQTTKTQEKSRRTGGGPKNPPPFDKGDTNGELLGCRSRNLCVTQIRGGRCACACAYVCMCACERVWESPSRRETRRRSCSSRSVKKTEREKGRSKRILSRLLPPLH